MPQNLFPQPQPAPALASHIPFTQPQQAPATASAAVRPAGFVTVNVSVQDYWAMSRAGAIPVASESAEDMNKQQRSSSVDAEPSAPPIKRCICKHGDQCYGARSERCPFWHPMDGDAAKVSGEFPYLNLFCCTP